MKWKLYIDDNRFMLVDIEDGHRGFVSLSSQTDAIEYQRSLDSMVRMCVSFGVTIIDERKRY